MEGWRDAARRHGPTSRAAFRPGFPPGQDYSSDQLVLEQDELWGPPGSWERVGRVSQVPRAPVVTPQPGCPCASPHPAAMGASIPGPALPWGRSSWCLWVPAGKISPDCGSWGPPLRPPSPNLHLTPPGWTFLLSSPVPGYVLSPGATLPQGTASSRQLHPAHAKIPPGPPPPRPCHVTRCPHPSLRGGDSPGSGSTPSWVARAGQGRAAGSLPASGHGRGPRRPAELVRDSPGRLGAPRAASTLLRAREDFGANYGMLRVHLGVLGLCTAPEPAPGRSLPRTRGGRGGDEGHGTRPTWWGHGMGARRVLILIPAWGRASSSACPNPTAGSRPHSSHKSGRWAKPLLGFLGLSSWDRFALPPASAPSWVMA